jgi:hypothetical protein
LRPPLHAPYQAVNQQRLTEELARDPRRRRANRRQLSTEEAQAALLAYVRVAAEEQQQPGRMRGHARTPHDAAAELRALAALAAIHATHQQQQQQQQQQQEGGGGQAVGLAAGRLDSKRSRSEGAYLDLLRAYAALDDAPCGGSGGSGGSKQARGAHSPAEQVEAAMQALYAFAHLGDAARGELQHRSTARDAHARAPPGRLSPVSPGSSSSSSRAAEPPRPAAAGSHSKSSGPAAGAIVSRSSGGSASDLQVLLQLAQLTLQAAT